MRFIYVMSDSDKKKMIEMGYQLMKENSNGTVFIFANKEVANFDTCDELSRNGVRFISSDILTF